MAEHLAVMAAHVRSVVHQRESEAVAGATLMQVRAHLEEGAWRRWVEREVRIPVERARELMDAAERAGASVESLRPREFQN
ncbi:MAG: hypothetical protein ABMB14_35600 [Myxococcota bacterium]